MLVTGALSETIRKIDQYTQNQSAYAVNLAKEDASEITWSALDYWLGVDRKHVKRLTKQLGMTKALGGQNGGIKNTFTVQELAKLQQALEGSKEGHLSQLKEALNEFGQRVIVFGNEKGGVGKSTVASNMAAFCSHLGLKTLMIDLDPQAASTTKLGYEAQCEINGVDPGAANTLLSLTPKAMRESLGAHVMEQGSVPFTKAVEILDGLPIKLDRYANLDLIPAHRELYKLLTDDFYIDYDVFKRQGYDQTVPADATLMKKNVIRLMMDNGALARYDVIIVDSIPSISEVAMSMAYAATNIIAVSEAKFEATNSTSKYLGRLAGAWQSDLLADPAFTPKTHTLNILFNREANKEAARIQRANTEALANLAQQSVENEDVDSLVYPEGIPEYAAISTAGAVVRTVWDRMPSEQEGSSKVWRDMFGRSLRLLKYTLNLGDQ